MNIRLVRDDCTAQRTLGTMTFEDGFACETLEDVVRPAGVKVAGETAIPSGIYAVTITKSVRFGKLMPLISNVPGFTGIRIHAGNTTADTSGCILVATSRGQHNNILGSRIAMAQVQQRIAEELKSPTGVCTIEILRPQVTTTETFRLADGL